MRIHSLVAVLFLGAVALSPRAEAQCAGFSDVGGTSINPTCANVTWMKNRLITLGCTPTAYCPSDAVGRLQMAAFMNRVGNAMTPKVFSSEQSGGTLDFSADHVICQTAELPAPAKDYARTIDAEGSLSLEVNGLQSLIVWPVMSKNGGSWSSLGQGSYPVVDPGVRHNVGAVAPAVLLFDNSPSTLKFGLRVARQNQFGPAITSWSCHLQVLVRNATYALEF